MTQRQSRRPSSMWLTVLFVLGAVLPSCSDSPDERRVSGGEPGRAEQLRYALLALDGWELREARDLRPDDPIASIDEPPLDWYAEYVAGETSAETEVVRLSGHDSSLEATQRELEQLGFELDLVGEGTTGAVGGDAPSDPAGPRLVILDGGDRSFVVLSYDLDLEDLLELTSHIEPADESTWIEAGGVID